MSPPALLLLTRARSPSRRAVTLAQQRANGGLLYTVFDGLVWLLETVFGEEKVLKCLTSMEVWAQLKPEHAAMFPWMLEDEQLYYSSVAKERAALLAQAAAGKPYDAKRLRALQCDESLLARFAVKET